MDTVDLKSQVQAAISLINSGQDTWVPFYSSLSQLPLSAKEQLVLLTLQRFSFYYSVACPTIRHLAQEVGISKSTVSRAIQKLAAIGLISYRQEGRGLSKHNVYTICFSVTPLKKSVTVNNSFSARLTAVKEKTVINVISKPETIVSCPVNENVTSLPMEGCQSFLRNEEICPFDDPEWEAQCKAEATLKREEVDAQRKAIAEERMKALLSEDDPFDDLIDKQFASANN